MRKTMIAAALGLGLGLAGAAEAQNRTKNIGEVSGWEAVGRLTMANKAMCTGALIASNMVLTAAHCLYDPKTGRTINPKRIVFEAGLNHGRARAVRKVSKAVSHPGYRPARRGEPQAGVDIAVLRLETPINSATIMPLTPHTRPEKGDSLGVISYTHMQKNSPILQQPCQVMARKHDTLVTNCEVDFGASGAPVFAVQGGVNPQLVSVISAKAAMGGRAVSVGTILDQTLQSLLDKAG